VASQSGAAAAWDAEYAAGRYSCEPPVAFTGDILAAARQAGLTRGLYIGCGNGRNYLPLVAGGLDLTGVDISAAAIAQLAARAPDRADRLVCGDLGALPAAAATDPASPKTLEEPARPATPLAMKYAGPKLRKGILKGAVRDLASGARQNCVGHGSGNRSPVRGHMRRQCGI